MNTQAHFTLIELVVSLAIISVVTTLAVANFRGETPSQIINSQTVKFQTFCAQARFRAAENSRDVVVNFDPETNEFTADFIRDEAEIEKMELEGIEPIPPLKFKLSEKFVFSTLDNSELQLFSGETLEILRFYPDGSGSSKRQLTLQYEQLKKHFKISPLSGQILITEGEINE